MKASLVRMQTYLTDRRVQFQQSNLTDCVYEEEKIQLDSIQLDDLESAIPKLDDSKAEVQDPLK